MHLGMKKLLSTAHAMSERVARARFILYIYDDKDHIQLVYFEMERAWTNEWMNE